MCCCKLRKLLSGNHIVPQLEENEERWKLFTIDQSIPLTTSKGFGRGKDITLDLRGDKKISVMENKFS